MGGAQSKPYVTLHRRRPPFKDATSRILRIACLSSSECSSDTAWRATVLFSLRHRAPSLQLVVRVTMYSTHLVDRIAKGRPPSTSNMVLPSFVSAPEQMHCSPSSNQRFARLLGNPDGACFASVSRNDFDTNCPARMRTKRRLVAYQKRATNTPTMCRSAQQRRQGVARAVW